MEVFMEVFLGRAELKDRIFLYRKVIKPSIVPDMKISGV